MTDDQGEDNVTRMRQRRPEATTIEHVCEAYQMRVCVTTIYGRKRQGEADAMWSAIEAEQAKGVQVAYGSNAVGTVWWREVSTLIRFDYCATGGDPIELELPLTQFLEIVGLTSPMLGSLSLPGLPGGPGAPLGRRGYAGIERIGRV